MYLEVPIGLKNGNGEWPEGTKVRRIDAIRCFEGEVRILPASKYTYKSFSEDIKGKHLELIEVKKYLNRLVIGQVIAGIDMFNREYAAKSIKGIILCQKGDPALEWVCKEHGIEVYAFENIEDFHI